MIGGKKQSLQGFLKEKAGRKETVRRDELSDMLKQCDIDLPKEYLEYFLASVIESSNTINELSFPRIDEFLETCLVESCSEDNHGGGYCCVEMPENLLRLRSELEAITVKPTIVIIAQ